MPIEVNRTISYNHFIFLNFNFVCFSAVTKTQNNEVVELKKLTLKKQELVFSLKIRHRDPKVVVAFFIACLAPDQEPVLHSSKHFRNT